MFYDWICWVIQRIYVDVTSKKTRFIWWWNLWQYFFEESFKGLEVCSGESVTQAWNNQVFGVIFNFYIKHFRIWITLAKAFTYFEIYSFPIKHQIPPPLRPFLSWCNAIYFRIQNSELFFAALSVHVSVKTITFNLPIFLFRLLILKWNIEHVSLFGFSEKYAYFLNLLISWAIFPI